MYTGIYLELTNIHTLAPYIPPIVEAIVIVLNRTLSHHIVKYGNCKSYDLAMIMWLERCLLM